MDEQAHQYAQEMMRQYHICESSPVSIRTRLKRLKKRLVLAAHRFLHEDVPKAPAQTDGVFAKIGGFLQRSGRVFMRWMVQQLVLLASKLMNR